MLSSPHVQALGHTALFFLSLVLGVGLAIFLLLWASPDLKHLPSDLVIYTTTGTCVLGALFIFPRLVRKLLEQR